MFADLREFAPGADKVLYSFGMTCQLLPDCTPDRMKAVMRAAEVRFTEIRDGIGYFDTSAFMVVCEQYKTVQADIDRRIAQTAANN